MNLRDFRKSILQGIPDKLPEPKSFDLSINHAPKRKDILNKDEKNLALRNALRYFDKKFHSILVREFQEELKAYGRIYMSRFRPDYKIYARPLNDYPCKSKQAAAVMHMISNNLDEEVAQHPHELITYGGNGAVFQNWVQYLITMKYLAQMTNEQTLVLYSGHPMGLFPSHKNAPRVVITNGMMIPNYSKPDDWERFNALGVTQYGQMTAGSFMYIGSQGIVHGTTITLMKAGAKGSVFVSSGLGGMSGAQPKAAKIAGAISIIAEVNLKAIEKRHSQGWVDEVYSDIDLLLERLKSARKNAEVVSIAFHGNVVDVWEALAACTIKIDIGTDQTSLHNPYSGGYYPAGISFDEANRMMAENPELFKQEVRKSLVRQVIAINKMAARGMYFFDYGNAFLLEAERAGAAVMVSPDEMFAKKSRFRYPSYVQDIVGPFYFDYGFGPFRWICMSADPEDLKVTDKIAVAVLKSIIKKAPVEIKQQLSDNIEWLNKAAENKLVVGSQARILYADAEARIKIASAFNKAIRLKRIKAPVVLGRDHHDVSGTDSPYRETSNIYDGSQFTADMSVQNFAGDSFRGATWVSLHNGGGVGWGEVINGGFGLVLDGSREAETKLKSMLDWDVNNGIARRSWARNPEAIFAIKRAMKKNKLLKVTLPNLVDDNLLSIPKS